MNDKAKFIHGQNQNKDTNCVFGKHTEVRAGDWCRLGKGWMCQLLNQKAAEALRWCNFPLESSSKISRLRNSPEGFGGSCDTRKLKSLNIDNHVSISIPIVQEIKSIYWFFVLSPQNLRVYEIVVDSCGEEIYWVNNFWKILWFRNATARGNENQSSCRSSMNDDCN